jgi:hypothetical protein
VKQPAILRYLTSGNKEPFEALLQLLITGVGEVDEVAWVNNEIQTKDNKEINHNRTHV